MKQFKAKIISNKKIAKDHYSLFFSASTKSVKPGQFFNVRITNKYEPFLRRPFGAHKIMKNGIEILYKVVGKATKVLSKKKKGESLDILGPLGNGFTIKKNETAFLVGGGHGVAPLYALSKKLVDSSCEVKAFIGACSKEHVVCDKELKKIGAKVYVATDDGSKGYKGLVTELLKKNLKDIKRGTIYACGPKPMLKAVAKLSGSYKIPCQLSLEEYMACGVGTCLGCAVKTKEGYKMVCKDGPIFNAKDIIWQI